MLRLNMTTPWGGIIPSHRGPRNCEYATINATTCILQVPKCLNNPGKLTQTKRYFHVVNGRDCFSCVLIIVRGLDNNSVSQIRVSPIGRVSWQAIEVFGAVLNPLAILSLLELRRKKTKMVTAENAAIPVLAANLTVSHKGSKCNNWIRKNKM